MPEDQKGGQEVVGRYDDGREPADGVAADGGHIAVKAVHDVPVGVFAHGQPVGIDDLVKDIRLDIIINIDAQPGRDPVDYIPECQVEDRAPDHDSQHDSQLVCLITCNDINQVFAGNAGDQTQRRTDDAKQGIESDRAFVSGTVGEDSFPVINDFPEGTVLDPAE